MLSGRGIGKLEIFPKGHRFSIGLPSSSLIDRSVLEIDAVGSHPDVVAVRGAVGQPTPLHTKSPGRVVAGLHNVGLDQNLGDRTVDLVHHGNHAAQVTGNGLDDQGVGVFVHQHRPQRFSLSVERQELLHIFPQHGRAGIADFDHFGRQRLCLVELISLFLPLQFGLHVLHRHDADDVPLPGIGQSLGAQYALKDLIPGSFRDIDVDLARDLIVEHDILIGNPGQGSQQNRNVDVVHFHGDFTGRQRLFRGRLQNIGFGGCASMVACHRFPCVFFRRRGIRLGIGHPGFPFLENALLRRRRRRCAAQNKDGHQREAGQTHQELIGSVVGCHFPLLLYCISSNLTVIFFLLPCMPKTTLFG